MVCKCKLLFYSIYKANVAMCNMFCNMVQVIIKLQMLAIIPYKQLRGYMIHRSCSHIITFALLEYRLNTRVGTSK